MDTKEDIVDLNVDLETLTIQRDEIGKLLEQISPLDREILFLWAVEGMSFEEISKELDIRRGTLLSRMSRLRSHLSDKEEKNEKTP